MNESVPSGIDPRHGTIGGVRPTITATVVACDEAEYLEACLRSLRPWVDEIVVLDMSSRDGTADVAARFADQVTTTPWAPYAEAPPSPGQPSAKQQAIASAKSDWILILDPDECLPASTGRLLRKIAESDDVDVVELPRRNMFFGSDVNFLDYEDDVHPRFFRRGHLDWPTALHSHPDLSRLRVLRLAVREGNDDTRIVHDSWRRPNEVLAKLGRYVESEASAARATGRTFSMRRLLVGPFREFGRRYIKYHYWRDGMPGLLAAIYFAINRMSVEAQIWVLEQHPLRGSAEIRD